ncbi:MAG: AAA family ATPase [bacterium]|nr:AAA family ATPase [bacterium]
MYQEIFRSPTRPFRATPDPKFYFPFESIEAARRTTLRAMDRAEGPVAIMGGAGLGKSMLGEMVALDLASRFDIVKLRAARLCSRGALLQSILFELNLPYKGLTEGELRLSLLDRLTPSGEYSPEGIVILVDEAHTLPEKLLEELRLITNFTRDNQPRARLVLIGNMKLEEIFASPRLESFNQRLAARCYLSAMKRDETVQYIEHQIRMAGYKPSEFLTSEGLQAVYAASEGVPRLVNQVMDHTLVLAINNNVCPASASLIEEAWAELQQLPVPWPSAADRMPNVSASVEAGGAAIEFGSLEEELEDSHQTKAFEGVNSSSESTRLQDSAIRQYESISKPVPTYTDSEPWQQPNQQPPSSTYDQNRSDTSVLPIEFSESYQAPSDPHVADFHSYQVGEMQGDFVFEEIAKEQTRPADNTPVEGHRDVNWDHEEVRADTEQNNFFAAFTEPDPRDFPETESADEEVSQANDLFIKFDKGSSSLSGNRNGSISFGFTPDFAEIDIEMPHVLPSDSFFQDRETDEKLLAIHEEQEQFSSIENWQQMSAGSNQPQYGQSGSTTQDVAMAYKFSDNAQAKRSFANGPKADSPSILFGDDFEEEVSIHELDRPRPRADEHPAIEATPNNVTPNNFTPNDATLAAAELQTQQLASAAGPRAGVDVDVEVAASVEDEVLIDLETLMNIPGSTASASPWSLDVLATDANNEVLIQKDIDALLAQLNFQGVSDSFSVERIDINAKPFTNSKTPEIGKATVQDGQEPIATNGHDDEQNLLGDNWSSYDDDRDLLVIDEEVVPSVTNTVKPKTSLKRPSYTQLFAKLRK